MPVRGTRIDRREGCSDIPIFLPRGHQWASMKTTRKGLRAGELEKDTYGRLNCKECGESLKTKNDPDEVYTVRRCPDCEQEWKELR